MGWGFRKSINLGGGVRLNLSKRGVGVSAGTKGFRVSAGPNGVRRTVSIPGTGIYHTQKISGGSSRRASSNKSRQNGNYNQQQLVQAPKYPLPLQKALSPALGYFFVFIAFIALMNAAFGSMLVTLAIGIAIIMNSKKELNQAKLKYNEAIKILTFTSHKKDMALEKLLESNRIDPQNISTKKALAFVYHDFFKDYANAYRYIEPVYANGNQADALTCLIMGSCLMEKRDYKKAINLLIPYANDPQINLEVGKAYYHLGDYEESIATFKKGPVLKRTYTTEVIEYKYWLGLSYLENGDKQKAKTQLSKVYQEAPDFKDIKTYARQLSL